VKLRDKKFEKAVRLRARAKMRESPAAWREFKRVRRGWWTRNRGLPPWITRFVPPFIFIAIWGLSGRRTEDIVALILLASVASIAWRAGQLLIALRTSQLLPFYAHFPLTDEEVFKLQWKYYVLRTAWSIVDFVVFYGVLAERAGYGWNWWLVGIGMAVAQWLVILSAATSLIAYVRSRKFFRVAIAFGLLAIVLFFLPSAVPFTRSLAELAAWVPPLGWALYSMGISPPHNLLFEWWTALSFAGILFLLPQAYRKLCKTFVMPELANAKEVTSGAIEARRRSQADGLNPEAFAGITDAIRRREFLKESAWRKTEWVERFAASWLSPHERVTMEFMTARNPSWTKRLYRLALVLGGFALLTLLFPRFLRHGVILMVYAPIFLLWQAYVAGWEGAALRNVGGSNISIFTTYPVGFWQIARVIIKTNLARLVILAPFLAVGGFLLTGTQGLSQSELILWSLKITVAVVACSLLAPMMLISAGTNDGSSWRIILAGSVWILVGLVSCGALYLAPTWGWLTAASGLMMGVCAAALAIYGRAYNHNWFDLQSKPKESVPARPQ
jgi:hypothetical protein